MKKNFKKSIFAPIIFLLLGSCSSNSDIGDKDFPENYEYEPVCLNFLDSTGEDMLISLMYHWWPGGEFNNKTRINLPVINDFITFYSLNIVYPDSTMIPPEPDMISELVIVKQQNSVNNYKMEFRLKSRRNYHNGSKILELPPADKITIQLQCSYLFGNTIEHKIVTHWKEGISSQQLCYRLEIDGIEYELQRDNTYAQAVTVIVNPYSIESKDCNQQSDKYQVFDWDGSFFKENIDLAGMPFATWASYGIPTSFPGYSVGLSSYPWTIPAIVRNGIMSIEFPDSPFELTSDYKYINNQDIKVCQIIIEENIRKYYLYKSCDFNSSAVIFYASDDINYGGVQLKTGWNFVEIIRYPYWFYGSNEPINFYVVLHDFNDLLAKGYRWKIDYLICCDL